MKHKNKYYELDVRFIGDQSRTREQYEEDIRLTGEYLKAMREKQAKRAKKKASKSK